MLRISKLTDYATVILAGLSEQDAGLCSATGLAEKTGVGLPTVSKLLKELQRAGLVVSVRGARGGYQLARAASEISASDIIDAVEGPVSLTECSSHQSLCELEENCQVGHSWQRVNVAIRQALTEVRLTDLTARNGKISQPDLRHAVGGWRPLNRMPGS